MWFRMATASTSASTAEAGRRARKALAGLALLASATFGAAPATALELESFRGHLAIGYGKLIESDAPAGSISFSGGVEYPIGSRWTTGVEIGYWLLGTRIEERGSLSAEADYSAFEALALARWMVPNTPLDIAFGPGVMNARADLTSVGVAGFTDLAVEETRATAALSVTAIQRKPAPVRLGFELTSRMTWLTNDTWTLLAARLAIHY